MLNLLKKEANKTLTTNGDVTNKSSLNHNLDLFSITNFKVKEDLILRAYLENEDMFIKNMLYHLDIREGKGYREYFKKMFSLLIEKNPKKAIKLLNFIPKLGRYDYLLLGLDDNKNKKETIDIIRKTLNDDLIENENITLLAKWLPSTKTKKEKNKKYLKILLKELDMSEKSYRKMLTKLRKKIDIVETRLSKKQKIENFDKVPGKAMLKYRNCFSTKKLYKDDYSKYLKSNKKANANTLFIHEIVRLVYNIKNRDLANKMWESQKDLFEGQKPTNLLCICDTSASMKSDLNGIVPMDVALGLSIYIAERNKGIFKNHFITFSRKANLVEILGEKLSDKIRTFKPIVENTNISSVFSLLLNTIVKNNVPIEEQPSHLILLSDMEFDSMVDEYGTYEMWKKRFEQKGVVFPKIIFWNLNLKRQIFPVLFDEKGTAMIGGFSKNILKNLFSLEQFDPLKIMQNTLSKYDSILKNL